MFEKHPKLEHYDLSCFRYRADPRAPPQCVPLRRFAQPTPTCHGIRPGNPDPPAQKSRDATGAGDGDAEPWDTI
ncbi:hypothetical protein B0H67DRAFT_108086 [Lasiosphaeris hirsuta]|uniref:Uncharacterized protein n=1 Tax=Lasiosphaeris hirsuta TaxID=260670 RepID=A0AA40AYY0_9PEZI|nr:hypothetical protein B0H67DRAFT_108086 [Lasiosphaeris hirsuta]